MKLLSVNVGLPREVVSGDRLVLTSIFKSPVTGRVPIRNNNLAGDQQSDPSVHGGRAKAIYVYPHEHYAFWREQLPDVALQPGNFGENLTIEGLLEQDVHVGDRLKVGSAELVVTQPRMPCYKLGIKFGRPDVLRRMLRTGRTGFYFSVAVEGEVGAGDAIEPIGRAADDFTVADVVRLFTVDSKNRTLLRRATENPALAETWKDYFRDRLR